MNSLLNIYELVQAQKKNWIASSDQCNEKLISFYLIIVLNLKFSNSFYLQLKFYKAVD